MFADRMYTLTVINVVKVLFVHFIIKNIENNPLCICKKESKVKSNSQFGIQVSVLV